MHSVEMVLPSVTWLLVFAEEGWRGENVRVLP